MGREMKKVQMRDMEKIQKFVMSYHHHFLSQFQIFVLALETPYGNGIVINQCVSHIFRFYATLQPPILFEDVALYGQISFD